MKLGKMPQHMKKLQIDQSGGGGGGHINITMLQEHMQNLSKF
jgi:hypothetical protein